jgi:hypothetical protein
MTSLTEIRWLSVLRRYLVIMVPGSFIWESSHMPLYTLWETGSTTDIVFAVLHCSAGDTLIALSALTIALVFFGTNRWPEHGYKRVALVSIVIGFCYMLFSEWLNIEIRETWAYRELMPVIPVIDAGLSPIAQWIVLPTIAFWWGQQSKEKQ